MANANMGRAVISFEAETVKFIGDVGRAAAVFNSRMAQMQNAVSQLQTAIATAGSAGGLGMLVKNAINAGDELNKLSQKTGFSVQSLSALKFGAGLADLSMEQLTVGIKEFNKSIVEASDKNSKAASIFKALGVDLRQGPEAALKQTANAFQLLTDGELKSTAAGQLFGKQGLAWIPMLNQGARGMQEAADKARALGLVMGPEFAAKAEQFNDNLKILNTRGEALGITLADKLLEPLIAITTNLAKAAEKGDLLAASLREIGKLAAAGATSFPKSTIPGAAFGIFADRAAETLFNEGGGGSRTAGGRITGLPFVGPTQPPNADALRRALAENEKSKRAAAAALAKHREQLFISSRQSLEQQLGGLSGQTEEQKLREQLGKGSLRDLTADKANPGRPKELIELAKKVDALEQLNSKLKSQAQYQDDVAQAIRNGEQAQKDFFVANRDLLDQHQFESSMIGKTAIEQQKLTAAREIDLRMWEAIGKIDNPELNQERIKAIYEQADAMKKALIPMMEERLRKEQAWQTGAHDAIQKYVEDSRNGAQMAAGFFTNAFQSMEDALVKFVQTGKLDFKSLTDSIIADLIRIKIKRDIIGPLADSLDGALKGGGGIGGFFSNLLSANPLEDAVGGLLNFADGGRPPVGVPSIIGEAGPELFVPDAAGTIIPNDGLKGVGALTGADVFVNNSRRRGGDVRVTNNITVSGNGVTYAEVARAVAAGSRATLRAVSERGKR